MRPHFGVTRPGVRAFTREPDLVGTVSDDRSKAHRESSLIRWRSAVLEAENVSEKGEKDDTGTDRCVNTAVWLSRGLGLWRYECFILYVHTESVFRRAAFLFWSSSPRPDAGSLRIMYTAPIVTGRCSGVNLFPWPMNCPRGSQTSASSKARTTLFSLVTFVC